MLRLEEAQEIVLANAELRRTVEIGTLESLGGMLAEDVRADRDQPPFDRSMMDGYALRSADLPGPGSLRLLPQVVAAGVWPGFTLEPGQAVKIMTGAPLPRGADAVVSFEEVRVEAERIHFSAGAPKGDHVAPRGKDVRQGEVALPHGTRITPAVLGVIGSVGRQSVRVYQPPSVAILTTGNEIVEFNEHPSAPQIRNTNSLTLLGHLLRDGIEGKYLGLVRDDLEETVKALRDGLSCDIVLVTGGASVGDFDYMEPALKRLDARILVDRVALKPGKPVTFARVGERAVFSLPGNPVSAAVTYHLFVGPYIRKIMGSRNPLPSYFKAMLSEPLKKQGPRRHFVPCLWEARPEGAVAAPLRSGGSGDLVSFSRANGLIVAPEGEISWTPGQVVDLYPLEDPRE